MTEQKENSRYIGSIARENLRGLAKLADEEEAESMRDRPIRRKLKRLYRRYVKKPEAEPVEV